MTRPRFNRILLKLSGEVLMGEGQFGIDPGTVERLAEEIKAAVVDGHTLCLVVGGGNIYRGLTGAAEGMDRATGDYMGMLATVLNALALQDALEKAGAFSIVLEAMPAELGHDITREVQIPTIGIGAGHDTDAQVLVINDLLGINETVPKLAKKYVDLRAVMTEAVTAFQHDVESGAFPDDEHSYS